MLERRARSVGEEQVRAAGLAVAEAEATVAAAVGQFDQRGEVGERRHAGVPAEADRHGTLPHAQRGRRLFVKHDGVALAHRAVRDGRLDLPAGKVGRAGPGNVLHDHVDVYVRLCYLLEHPGSDAGPVRGVT